MTGKRTSKPSRRTVLKGLAAGGAAAASTQFGLFNINHAWSQDVHWDGEPFDADGATFILGEWGGFWEEFVRGAMLENFEKTYNCNVAYDSSWPWFPKYVAGGPQDPAFHMCNWNLPEMMKTARAGDYFLPIEDIKANVPNAADCWDFAFANGIGVTWAFGQYAYVYRTDLVDPAPADFKSFWEDRFAGNRATYITSNTLQMVFFITANVAWGEGPEDMDAGFDAMRRAMPMKISDFTGNMQTLVERGEVHLGVQWEGEVYLQMDKGISVAPVIWEVRKPILTQTKTISRYSEPMQKKLALALMNETLDPAYQAKCGTTFYLRPTNGKAVVADNLASKGVVNQAGAMEGLWIPDWNWYLDNEDDIVETTNEIFGG
jgi:putative spermidine/putrescine transport system substrate-binding protein